MIHAPIGSCATLHAPQQHQIMQGSLLTSSPLAGRALRQCRLRLLQPRPLVQPFTTAQPLQSRPASFSKPTGSKCRVNPFDAAWGTTTDIDAQSLAAQLFSFSIIPYAGFLYCLTRSKKTPPVALFGFYFLLVFVFGTIPAGIYAKTKFGTTLANVDILHGPAESLLTITNLLIVLGFRRGIKEAEQNQQQVVEGKESQQESAAGLDSE